jgi:hypothetical protein
VNALGGTDTTTVNDLSGTDVTTSPSTTRRPISGTAGDAAADLVIVNGTNGDDVIDVAGSAATSPCSGCRRPSASFNSEGANDSLVINALGGNDGVTATSLPAGVIKLTVDGGAGDDTLSAPRAPTSSSAATATTSSSATTATTSRSSARATTRSSGTPATATTPSRARRAPTRCCSSAPTPRERQRLANGGRVLFTRDVANVAMDLTTPSGSSSARSAGPTTWSSGDLSGTDLDPGRRRPPRPSGGGGDVAVDTVTVNGTQGDEFFGVTGDAGGVSTFGLHAKVNVFNLDPASDKLTLNGLGGEDLIDSKSLEADGTVLTVNGGLGFDVFLGGEGDELFNGGDGNDLALMGAGDDAFVWNPGDDNDSVEGEAGRDEMLFNGANVAENIDISFSGGQVLFFRNVANVLLDLNDTEVITFNALGGADTVKVGDLSGTDVTEVNVNLAVGGAGDAAADNVVVTGTDGNDVVLATGDAAGASVFGLAAQVNITGAEAASDRLTINAFAGDDVVEASGLAAGAIKLTADGGDGDDVLVGGAGDDVLIGGAGNDVLIGGPGTDVLDDGPGDDVAIQLIATPAQPVPAAGKSKLARAESLVKRVIARLNGSR